MYFVTICVDNSDENDIDDEDDSDIDKTCAPPNLDSYKTS